MWLPASLYPVFPDLRVSRHYDAADRLSYEGTALFGALIVVIVLLLIWFTVKCFELLVKVWRQHHTKLALRISGLVALVGMLLGMLAWMVPADAAAGVRQVLLGLAVVACFQHLVIAKVVAIWYNDLFLAPFDRDLLIHDVLQEPWFDLSYP